jgi:hypothetical protein
VRSHSSVCHRYYEVWCIARCPLHISIEGTDIICGLYDRLWKVLYLHVPESGCEQSLVKNSRDATMCFTWSSSFCFSSYSTRSFLWILLKLWNDQYLDAGRLVKDRTRFITTNAWWLSCWTKYSTMERGVNSYISFHREYNEECLCSNQTKVYQTQVWSPSY